MIGFLMGLQKGYIKFGCFLCLRNSRDRESHFLKPDWEPLGQKLPGEKNVPVTSDPLIPDDKVFLPPLHIKLGLFKTSLSAKEFLAETFPAMTETKLKEGVFVGPQLRQLMKKSDTFVETLNPAELRAWKALVQVSINFLGNFTYVVQIFFVQDLIYQDVHVGLNAR